MLDKFSFYHLQFYGKAKSPIPRMIFLENALRGGLGRSLMKAECTKKGPECSECLLASRCSYFRIFNPSNLDGKPPLKAGAPLPKPYVMSLAVPVPFRKSPGSMPLIEMVLIGRDKDEYLPYMLYAFSEMGRRGIARQKIKFQLEEVMSVDAAGKSLPVYDGNRIIRKPVEIRLEDLMSLEKHMEGVEQLTIDFLSPVRIKASNGKRGSLIHRPSFCELIKSLTWRIDLLHLYYCGGHTDYDYKTLLAEAETVKAVLRNPIYWRDLVRYSYTQKEPMNVDGFMGSMTYCGEGLEHFLPFLKLGEYIHIGKATTFGLGVIRVRADQPCAPA